jgi:hypothetical protein
MKIKAIIAIVNGIYTLLLLNRADTWYGLKNKVTRRAILKTR